MKLNEKNYNLLRYAKCRSSSVSSSVFDINNAGSLLPY